MKKKLITIIIAASLGCSMLIGCGSDTATTETTFVESIQVDNKENTVANNEATVSDNTKLTDENKQIIAEMEKYLENKYNKKFYIDYSSFTPNYKVDTIIDWRVNFSDTPDGEKTNIVSKNIYYNYCEDDYWKQIADKSLFEDKCKKVLKEYGFNCDVKMEFLTVPITEGYLDFTGDYINSNSTEEEWLDELYKASKNIKIYMLDYSEITDDLIKSVKYALTGQDIYNASCYMFSNTEIDKGIENKAVDFDLVR